MGIWGSSAALNPDAEESPVFEIVRGMRTEGANTAVVVSK